METVEPKMHFVPLGDIHETPHINDTSPIPPSQILHLSTGPKQADPAPIQARDLFVLENSIVRKGLTKQTGTDWRIQGFSLPDLQVREKDGRVFNSNPSLTHFEVVHFR
jgi:hypothetical protein